MTAPGRLARAAAAVPVRRSGGGQVPRGGGRGGCADGHSGGRRPAAVLDDMHWADHASLFLLRELAAELPGSRLLMLATCRETAGNAGRARWATWPGCPACSPPAGPLDGAALAECCGRAG